jgi:hypothetical protein
VVLLVLCFSVKKGLNEYLGVQTFTVKAKKGKPKKFQIESSDIPPVIFKKKKLKKDINNV